MLRNNEKILRSFNCRAGNMTTLCVISCGNRKIWDTNPAAGPTKARDVYIGPFAKKCKDYAEMFYPVTWCYLSPRYGFVGPDELVSGPYNKSFNIKSTHPITLKQLRAQIIKKGLEGYEEIVIIAGQNQVDIVSKVFPDKKIIAPLKDCKGLGCMVGLLNDFIKKGIGKMAQESVI